MVKVMKIISVVLGILVVLFVSIISYIVATFDPNQYKQQVIGAVKEKTARTLRLEGDIRLSVFPGVTMAVSRVAMSEPHSDQVFVEAESAMFSLKLLPLLSKRFEVDTVEVKGLVLHVVRAKDGRFNFDDLTSGGASRPAAERPVPEPGEKSPRPESPAGKGESLAFKIAGVVVEGGTLDYADQQTGRRVTVSNLRLETGAISDEVRSHISTSFDLKADEPALSLKVQLRSSVLADLRKQHFGLADLDLGVKGLAAQINNLDAGIKGDLEYHGTAKAINITKLAASVTGKGKDGDLVMKLDIPELTVAREKVDGHSMAFQVAHRGASQNLNAMLTIPRIEGAGESLGAEGMELAVELDGQGRSIKATLKSKLVGNVDSQTYEMSKFLVSLAVLDSSSPKSPLVASAEGSARLDLAKEAIGLEFSGRLDESRLEGKVGLDQFRDPHWTYDLSVDNLDVNRFMARSTKESEGGSKRAEKGQAKPAAGQSGGEIDLSVLEGIRADGAVHVGQLKVADFRSSNIRAKIQMSDGRLEVNPISAQLYGGSLNGSFSAQSASTPSFKLKQRVTGVDLGPLLKDASKNARLEGKTNVTLDLSTAGTNQAALKKQLDGTASLLITDGSVRGIDLAGTIREVKNKLREFRGVKTRAENRSEKTDFSELRGTFVLNNGVARNRDLIMKSPILRVTGEGDIDIGNDRIDYLLKPTVVPTSKGQGGKELAELEGFTVPVRISGPLKEPEYAIDYSALALEYGKGLLDRAKEEVKGGGGRSIGDALKGVFGR